MNAALLSRGHPYDLLRAFIATEFKVRYKHTLLGFVWSLLNPLLFALVFYVAFNRVLSAWTSNFFIFLMVGLFAWQWFANCINGSPSVFLGQASLIKKARFPRILLPMSMVGNHLVHFLLSLTVLATLLAVCGYYPKLVWLPGIPLLMLIQLGTVLGGALAIGSLNVFFRDLEHLVLVVVNLLFYMTPILYPPDAVPDKWRMLLRFNPLTYVVPPWRTLMMEGRLDSSAMAVGAAFSLAVLLLGLAVYRGLERRFAESI